MSCKARISQESGTHIHRPSMPLAQRPTVVDMSLTSTKPPCWPDDEEKTSCRPRQRITGSQHFQPDLCHSCPTFLSPPPPFPPVPGPWEFVSLLPDHGYHCTVADPPPADGQPRSGAATEPGQLWRRRGATGLVSSRPVPRAPSRSSPHIFLHHSTSSAPLARAARHNMLTIWHFNLSRECQSATTSLPPPPTLEASIPHPLPLHFRASCHKTWTPGRVASCAAWMCTTGGRAEGGCSRCTRGRGWGGVARRAPSRKTFLSDFREEAPLRSQDLVKETRRQSRFV